MNCRAARELFSARVDGFLTPEERVALDRHLEGCADCDREWERFSRTVGLLRAVPEARAPADFAQRVVEATLREPWHRRLLRGVFQPLHVKLPLEAAAIVLVSTLVFFLSRQSPEVQRAYEAQPRPQVAAPESALEKDRPAQKEEAPAAERPPVGGRTDVEREARKSAVPAPAAESKLAVRALGPFHLLGLLRPTNREALDRELGDLVKQVGGVLVRDADKIGSGSIVEVIVPRDGYPRLLAGLRQLGEFRVETRAQTFPEQVRIGIRISD